MTSSLPASALPDIEAELLPILQTYFGFSHFRRGQLDILRSILQSQDTLAVMPTGGGKSLCYQLPALVSAGVVVVVSPLISLMKDQVLRLRERGIPSGSLHTGQNPEEKREVFAALRTSDRFLLYLSPERVQKSGFAAWLKNQKLSLFAIDEAHCISQWGPDFRQDYHRLSLLRELRPDVPLLALTATATPQVLRDVAEQLGMRNPARHVYGFYRPNLFYQVEICENDAAKRGFIRSALEQFPQGRVLIYCGTRKQCEELSAGLAPDFAGVDFYHAGLDPERRNRVQNDYEEGRTRILTATNAFGMGIDHPDVRLVVHYQMPANIESYYQEIGRAGRDGNDSTCLMLYAKKDKGLHAYFITQSQAEERSLQNRWRALETIVQFAEGGECRHSGILTYFRDTQRIPSCGHCDVCAPESQRRVRVKFAVPTLAELTAKSKRRKAVSEGPLPPQAKQRYESLREWRKAFAQRHDVPAFLVFSNKTLQDLAVKHPKQLGELESIYGIGPQKIEWFGAELLECLQA
jgi:ATP-dependent DNA helicase, RecQ family